VGSASSGGMESAGGRSRLDLTELLILVVGLSVAGLAKGTSGMGLPLIATPILAGVFGPRLAVAIVTIPILASNSLLLVQGYRKRDLLRGIAPLFVASAIGTAFGTLLLASLDQRTFALLITIMVVVFLARGDRLDPRRFRQFIVALIVLSVANLLWRTFAA